MTARAKIGGRPGACTNLRSTYMHELDSAVGFEKYNDGARRSARARRPSNRPPNRPTPTRSIRNTWNNKQAPGYNDAATGHEYASVYRFQPLDNNISSYLSRGHGKMTLTDLINAMGNAGTQDLRGVEVLPYALQIIGTRRPDRSRPPSASCAPGSRRALIGSIAKDLRVVLGGRARDPLNRVFCGDGSRKRCRAALGSLSEAIAESPQQVYPSDGACAAGDQMCSDSIQFRAVGAITRPLIEWVNRPTFQQAVQIQGP